MLRLQRRLHYTTVMIELRQTEAFSTWWTRLKDERARGLIAARIIQDVQGLSAFDKGIMRSGLPCLVYCPKLQEVLGV